MKKLSNTKGELKIRVTHKNATCTGTLQNHNKEKIYQKSVKISSDNFKGRHKKIYCAS